MASRGGTAGGDNWFDRDSDGEAERELRFETPDERLPWLESDDDGAEPPAYDTGRLVGFALILLVVLAVIVGGIWFVTQRAAFSGPVADGSLIEAPPGPYKERPKDAGGKVFAGTGDTSYAVGEGKEVEGRLAADTPAPPTLVPGTPTPAPQPSAKTTPAASATPAPGKTAEPPVSALPAGTAVQVGAYSSRADAEAGWRRLTTQTDALSGVSYRIFAGKADIGTVYRLQAVGGDRAGAQALCARLRSSGIACQVK